MSRFYYLAVSSTDNRRMNGEIETMSEDTARSELNRMGLSVLSISSEPFPDQEAGRASRFDFEGEDRTGKKVSGTIDARDLVGAYHRLSNEFTFKVSYLVSINASGEEKARARKDGIVSILKAEKATQEKAAAARRKTGLKGSLTSLVKKAEGKLRMIPSEEVDVDVSVKVAKATENNSKNKNKEISEKQISRIQFGESPQKESRTQLSEAELELVAASGEFQANRAEFTAKDFATEKEKLLLNKTTEEAELTKERLTISDSEVLVNSVAKVAATEPVEEEPELQLVENIKGESEAEPKTEIKSQMTVVLDGAIGKVFGSISKVTNAKLDAKDLANESQKVLSKVWGALQKVHLNSFLLFLRELTGVLAVAYLVSFIALHFVVRYSLGAWSEFAGVMVEKSTLLAFLTLAFIVINLSLSAQIQFRRDVLLRSSLMYALAGGGLFFVGINVIF